MGDAVEQGISHELVSRYPCRRRAEHCLADYQADIVGKPVMQTPPPMRRFCPGCRGSRHPYVAVGNPDRTQWHIVSPEIECRAAAQIETGVVPVAGEDAVLNAAAVERKPHVWATVVERDYVIAIGHDQHCPSRRANHHPAAVAQFVKRADANETSAQVVQWRLPS